MVEKHGIFQGYYFFHHIGMDRNVRGQFRTRIERRQRSHRLCS